jgi:hypothetical protein
MFLFCFSSKRKALYTHLLCNNFEIDQEYLPSIEYYCVELDLDFDFAFDFVELSSHWTRARGPKALHMCVYHGLDNAG